MDLCLRFNESEIRDWAERYRQCQKMTSRKAEHFLIERKICIQRKGFMTKHELYKISYWKYRRNASLVLEEKDTKIEDVTKRAFTEGNDWDKLETLTELHGIGHAKASAILHLYDKDCYPIVDKFAAWSVGRQLKNRQAYSKEFWLAYVKFCRGLANQNGLDMRTVDRALMHYGYIHSETEEDKSLE